MRRMSLVNGSILGLGLVLAVGVGAAPLDSAQADGLLTVHRIPAALASEAVAEAVASCARQHYAETAAIVDADGVLVAELRGDGVGAHSLDSAFSKAFTSASFKTDTLIMADRAKTNTALPILTSKLPHLLLLGGGVVIKAGDEVIGAIGAAGAPGADLDDACAKAGLDKIKDRLK
ncbi:MAG TPA: heme-binding protein [Magnetospirillaceae bacterium]|jgi:uncharacterized protein GlcG (DUF336 family)